jgi:hypothetical protein
MRDIESMFLPMLAFKGYHLDFTDRGGLQAAHIDAVTFRMRSGYIERFNAAHFAKQMLGDTGIECVRCKRFRTLDESELRFRHDEMKKTALAADRTIAIDGFYLRRRFDLKLHYAAMAPTAMLDQRSYTFQNFGQPPHPGGEG